MAFNPFETFSAKSRTGKSIMAIIGIVVMFTFVLSTGAMGTGNDFFDQIGGLFNSEKKGDVLATAYGDKIRQAELSEVKRQRRAAVGFLHSALDESYLNWAKTLEVELGGSRVTPETKRDLERFIALKVNSQKDMQAYFNNFLRPLVDFRSFQFGPEIQRLQAAFTRVKGKPESEDKKIVDAVGAILMHDIGKFTGASGYSTVELGDSDQDLMDFIILLRKADKMDIHYSDEGILALLDRDLSGRVDEKARLEIQRKMKQNNRELGEFTGDWLMQAIGNEFRAQAVMTALRGTSPQVAARRQSLGGGLPAMILGIETDNHPMPGTVSTMSAMPGALTPHEFWEFFKDQTSEHSFALLEFPAESFIEKVTAEPTAKELRDLFAKHRGDLPDPSLERPGFKEPRRVKASFVTLDSSNARINAAIPALEAASTFLCASQAIGGESPAAALFAAAQPAMAQTLPAKQALAERMAENDKSFSQLDQFFFTPRDVSIYRPEPIVALLAGFGGHPSIPGAIAPYAAMFRLVERHDVRSRVPVYMQAFLTPFTPTFGNAVGLPAYSFAVSPKPVPEGLYLADVKSKLAKERRLELFMSDVVRLQMRVFEATGDDKPIDPKAPKSDKSKAEKAREAAKAIVDAWAAERKLTVASTKNAVDQFSAATDPDLQPLNALAKPEQGSPLSMQLFEMERNQLTGQPTGRAQMQPYRPEWFPSQPIGDAREKPSHLLWVTDEIESRTYNTLDNADNNTNKEMTARVTRAWKLNKARDLAKAAAAELAEKVRAITKNAKTNPGGVDKELRDLASQEKANLIRVPDIAVLAMAPEATQANMRYSAPKIDTKQVAHPTPTFAMDLLALRKEPVGAVTVLNDAPRSKFYVAACVDRNERTLDEFRYVFSRSTAVGAMQDPLYFQHALVPERTEATKLVLERLRAEANYTETDAFKNREKKDAE